MKQNERKNNDGWISSSQALSLLNGKGLSVTKIGLLYIGKRNDCIRKAEDGFHWEYELKKILKYVEDRIGNRNEGYFSIVDICKKKKMSSTQVYYRIKKYNLQGYRYGRSQALYINLKEFENEIERERREKSDRRSNRRNSNGKVRK